MNSLDQIITRLQQYLTGQLVAPDKDAANSALVNAFFNPEGMPTIPVYIEERGTVQQTITNALIKQGISVFIGHIEAKSAKTNVGDPAGNRWDYFADIPIFCYVLENPKTNNTSMDWGSLTRVLEWWLPMATPNPNDISAPTLKLVGSTIATPPQIDDTALKSALSLRSRLALFTLSTGFYAPQARTA